MKLLKYPRGLLFVIAAVFTGAAYADGSDHHGDRGWGHRHDHHGWGHSGDYWWAKNHKSDYFACATTPPVKVEGTIVDAAVATPALSTLVGAVVGAGLVDTLNSPGPFTVFAPTNDAFANIPASILTPIVGDVDLLTAVLTYHVVAGANRHIDPRWVYRRAVEVETVQGQTLFFNRNGGPQVNQSNVSCQPVHTSNGVVYVIDSVLLPQF